jgi:predicted RNA-binding protein (virulence factor B family)
MITLGKSYTLQIIKLTEFGAFIDAQNYGEILIPKKHAPKFLKKGDWLDIFLYLDSDDKPIATTQVPKVHVGEFAYLPVIDITSVGAFLDWGLDKDLLVPFSEQHRPMQKGDSYLVYVYIDKVDNRITASSKIDKFLDYEKPHTFKVQEQVNLIIANSTEIGYKAIINHSHWGMLYKNEVHRQISFGDYTQGSIKNIRPDGRIDLILRTEKLGKELRDKDEQLILSYLTKNSGRSSLNDKSDPKDIAKAFSMSKGSFKKAIGRLYKQEKIIIEENGFYLSK